MNTAMPANVLNYGRQQPRRTILIWLGIVATVLLAVGMVLYGPVLWSRLYRLHCQRVCAGYPLPADQVVYEEHPEGMAALLGSGRYARLEPTAESRNALRYSGYIPVHIAPCPSGVIVRKLPEQLHSLVGSSVLRQNGTLGLLFLGERHTPSDSPYIVAVYPAGLLSESESIQFGFRYTVIAPGTLIKPSRVIRFTGPIVYAENLAISLSALRYPAKNTGQCGPSPRRPLRLYAGQADPANPSRLTIIYETDGQRGTVEAVLTDELDLRFRVLDGPRASAGDGVSMGQAAPILGYDAVHP